MNVSVIEIESRLNERRKSESQKFKTIYHKRMLFQLDLQLEQP